MTKKKRSRLLSIAVIVLTVGVVFIIAFSNQDLASAWEVLFTLDPKWLAGCMLGFMGYVFFAGAALFAYLRQQGYRIHLSSAVHLAFTGIYYANITPGSSGGQPAQIYLMNKRSIPVGVATSALSVRFMASQTATVVITAVLWILNAGFVNTQLSGVRWLVVLGLAVNAAAIPLILLAILDRPLVARLAAFLVRIGAKLRLIKDQAAALDKVNAVLEKFHGSVDLALHHPFMMAWQVLLAVLEIVSLMSITVCVYHAFGQSGTPWWELLTVAFMLYVSASYTPLPGASGAQEGGFLLYYQGLFAGGTISLALLVWRFFSYYLFLLLGVGDTIITAIRRRKDPGLIAYSPLRSETEGN